MVVTEKGTEGVASKSSRLSRWEEADYEYSALQAERLVPFGGQGDSMGALEDLARRYPDYYPATLELGMRQGYAGTTGPAEDNLRLGLDLFVRCPAKRARKEEIEDTENVVLNLHDMYRFDLTPPFLNKMLERHPRAPSLWNLRANALAMSGDHAGAWDASGTAVKLAPKDGSLFTDRVLVAVLAGRLDDAQEALDRALALGEDDDDVVKVRRRTLVYLQRHSGMTFFDHLVRPHDDEALEDLDDDERDLDEENAHWNGDRLFAMGLERLRSGRIATFASTKQTLRLFYGLVGQGLLSNFTPLWEDPEVLKPLEDIFNTFVIRHTDGADALEEVCEALLELHAFFASHGLIQARDMDRLRKDIAVVAPQTAERARRYRECLEKDPSRGREALVRKIFGDRHRIAFF